MGSKKVDILVFAYYSFKDPVFQSAVLSYLIRFPKVEDRTFHLITFEHSKYQISDEEISNIQQDLSQVNTVWYRSKWRTAKRLKLVIKAIDFLQSLFICTRIILKNKVSKIYSEGFPGAIISHILCRVFKLEHIIHTFEPHADYMLEGKVWTEKSWEYKFLKRAEKRVAKRASDIITGTIAFKKIINNWTGANVHVFPSAVDLSHFTFKKVAREHLRSNLMVDKDEIVITYLGKFGGMYMDEEVFEFFAQCELAKLKCRYWIFSVDDHEIIRSKLDSHHIPPHKIIIKALSKDEVPDYLSASDIGLVAVRPYPSKRFCSPIKTGEYWACGLPAIIPKGVSDDFELVKDNVGGLAVSRLEDSIQYLKSIAMADRQKHRLLAIEHRDIEIYAAKISQMLC